MEADLLVYDLVGLGLGMDLECGTSSSLSGPENCVSASELFPSISAVKIIILFKLMLLR